jgi:tetratricopeptide (TPR) repeat protein
MLTQLKQLAFFSVPGAIAISVAALASLVLIDPSSSVTEAQTAPPAGLATATQALSTNLSTQATVAQPEKSLLPPASNPIATATQAFQQGETMRQAGQTDAALRHYEQALSLTQAAGHRSFEGVIWHRVAQTYAAVKDTHHATQFYQAAITIARETNNDYVLGEALANLGELSEQQGKAKVALAYYQESLPTVQSLGDQPIAQQVSTRIAAIKSQQAKATAIAKAKTAAIAKAKTAAIAKAKTTPKTATPKTVALRSNLKPVVN